jgi:glycosyltransferase involved in cell wall biosynthesis
MTQSYCDWECIVIDDNSTDNTIEIVQDFAAKDSRFTWTYNHKKKGAQGARNTGIELAKGEWICLFDSDDIMYSNYLETMVNAIESNVDVLVCQANIYDTKLQSKVGILDKIDSFRVHENLLQGKTYIAYDVTIIKRNKLLEINLLDEDCPSMQEWDTHIRLSKNAIYKSVNIPLCEWRIGENDTITSSNGRHIAGLVYLYMKHRWVFRKYAYRHFLNALFQVLGKVESRLKIFLKVPELLLYIPIKRIHDFFV